MIIKKKLLNLGDIIRLDFSQYCFIHDITIDSLTKYILCKINLIHEKSNNLKNQNN